MLPGYAASDVLPVLCRLGCAAWGCVAWDVPPRIAALELHPWELLPGRWHFAIMAVILAGVLFAVSDFVWIF